MGKAIIDLSTELLRELLFLPDDTAVLYAMLSEWPETIRLVIDSPAVPETRDEGVFPHVQPVFRREQSPSTVTMVDWGLPWQPVGELPPYETMVEIMEQTRCRCVVKEAD